MIATIMIIDSILLILRTIFLDEKKGREYFTIGAPLLWIIYSIFVHLLMKKNLRMRKFIGPVHFFFIFML
jgi:hypothetical protein